MSHELKISPSEISRLIDKKAGSNLAQKSALHAKANLLVPMLANPNRLGLTADEQQVVRRYARAAGEAAHKDVEERAAGNPLLQIDRILKNAHTAALARNNQQDTDRALLLRQDLRRREHDWRISVEGQLAEEKQGYNAHGDKDPNSDLRQVLRMKFSPIWLETQSIELMESIALGLGIELPSDGLQGAFTRRQEQGYSIIIGNHLNGDGVSTGIPELTAHIHYSDGSHSNVISSLTHETAVGFSMYTRISTPLAEKIYTSAPLPPLE